MNVNDCDDGSGMKHFVAAHWQHLKASYTWSVTNSPSGRGVEGGRGIRVVGD